MWQLFKKDVQRWIVPQSVSPPEMVTIPLTLKLLLRHMPLRAMFWFRLGCWCRQKRIPFVAGMVMRLLYRVHGLELPIGKKVGGGLYIAHPVGSTLNFQSMGENCTVIHSVTIGMRNNWEFPVIGDDVFIGAGARILGGVTIGDGARIGANAVVIRDVPANATAVGVPAKIIDATTKNAPQKSYPFNGKLTASSQSDLEKST